MTSKPHRARTPSLILASLLLSALALPGRATRPMPGTLAVTIPTELLSPCPRADYLSVKTAGDLAAFGVQEDAYLAVCDARRQEAVGIIQTQNAADAVLAKALKCRPWCRVWTN